MCGIVGLLRWDGLKADDVERVRRGMKTLIHRGPDGEGFWADTHCALGFRRLSIIDLSSAGHQPMTTPGSDVWLVFNGEIYNYLQLREQLEALGRRFHSRTDTETILHGYAEWGADVVTHLRGMFAFALWDAPRRRLLLARDRLGIKPLFYYRDAQRE